MTIRLCLLYLLLVPASVAGQTQSQHDAGVNARGDAVMGFSHQKTTHRFTLLADGGAIAVTAKDRADADSIGQIRGHLRHIAQMFDEGNFEAPMLIHAKTPPGVEVMRQRRETVTYTFEETPAGGRVRIATTDRAVTNAIHSFLRFQIQDHRTGDPKTVQPN